MVRTFLKLAVRGALGFVAGYVVVCGVLSLLGVLPFHSDLSQLEIDVKAHSLSVALWTACGTSVLTILFGGMRISKYWLWFCVVFGATCCIPFWPHKSGWLLPLATPYVNSGGTREVGIVLAIHVAISAVIAGVIHWVFPRSARHDSDKGAGDM